MGSACGIRDANHLSPFARSQVITSTTKIVTRTDSNGKLVQTEVPVWNWAVSNISLMAVGSSSPEILLALVECFLTLGQPAENLGAATIIGSGSFNLFAITAVCTVSVQAGELSEAGFTPRLH